MKVNCILPIYAIYEGRMGDPDEVNQKSSEKRFMEADFLQTRANIQYIIHVYFDHKFGNGLLWQVRLVKVSIYLSFTAVSSSGSTF